MEASLLLRQSVTPKPELFPLRKPNQIISKPRRITFIPTTATKNSSIRAAAPCSQVPMNSTSKLHPKPSPPPLFVGLPLDAVSQANTLNHSKAIAAGIRALKLLGVHGLDLPIHWSVVQQGAPDQFDWSAYRAIAVAARDSGLRLRVTLQLHGALPKWISTIAAADPDLLFTDRSGRRFPGCLSFAADDLPVLNGSTPMAAYQNFFLSFRSAFADLLGSTVTDVTVGLGPGGELRYPSFPTSSPTTPTEQFTGVGEFQCYGKYMLELLRTHAEASGNPLWGLGGPHDAPKYNQSPEFGNFFKDNGGSWETPYGKFFLNWYSGQLIAHADRLLSLASTVFDGLMISGKIPLIHSWYNTRSRPALLTAGYCHVDGCNGFDAIAEVFARKSCTMVVAGMDVAEEDRPRGVRSSPERLLSDIVGACERHGVALAGENSSALGAGAGFRRIKEIMLKSGVESFTYQRMGAYFFSPEHWPKFTEFVRGLMMPEMEADDVLGEEGERVVLPMDSVAGRKREMQAV